MRRHGDRETTLEEYVRSIARNDSDIYRAIRTVYREVEEGSAELIDPHPPRSYIEYLSRPDYSMWLWASASIVILTLILVQLTEILSTLTPARYVIGSIYVLFIPGYLLVEALYPYERSLSPLERLALSVGLSLAVVPLIGLILNYTSWGIRLWPVVFSLAIYDASMMVIASYRKYGIALLMFRKSNTGSRG